MITLRSDGEDDQPRDENGQWSSSGGGLSTPKSPEETKKLKSKIKEAQANVKLAEMIGPGATDRAKAKLADLEKQLGASTPAPAPKKTELKTPKAAAAPSSGKHIEALKALRSNFEEDGDPQNGFARATTGEIAKAMGVSPKEALTLLQKAAKEGLVARRGHTSQVGIGKKNRAGAVAEGFGYQIWDLKNSVKLP